MSAFSDNLSDLAVSLITEFGETGSFSRVVLNAYNPATAESATSVTTSYTGYVVPVDYKDKEIDGTLILRGDFKVLAHEMTQTPNVGDELTFNSKTCRIINVSATRVNGASVLYSLQCRI